MNVKEAIERIEKLEEDIKVCGDIVYMCSRDRERDRFSNNEITISAATYDQRYVRVSISDFVALLNIRRESAQAEISKLQPVIDMANMALKGVTNE